MEPGDEGDGEVWIVAIATIDFIGEVENEFMVLDLQRLVGGAILDRDGNRMGPISKSCWYNENFQKW